MKRNAQVQQVFTYILIALLIGIVFIIGYKAVISIHSKSCEADLIKFSQELEEISNLYNTYGLQREISIVAPCNYKVLCIINSSHHRSDSITTSRDIPNLLRLALSNDVSQNIYLGNTKDRLRPFFIVKDICVEKDYKCITAKGNRFTLVLKGSGDCTIIE